MGAGDTDQKTSEIAMTDVTAPRAREAQSRRLSMLMNAFGSAIAGALAEPQVLEVMVNPNGRLWLDRTDCGRIDTGQSISREDAERIIRLVASHMRREVTAEAPIISAELPETGERFEGVMPPVAPAPCFSIRKPAGLIYGLEDYIAKGIMDAAQADLLRQAIKDRANIVIAGGTSSGKTTLAKALLAEIAAAGDRVLILEDTRELQCAAPDHVCLRTKPGVVSLSDLVRSTLRLRPDRIIVGEVRGPEALDMLKAWNTGHPGGLTTLHANSAEAALTRLEQLIQEAVITVPRALLAEAIDMLVFITGRGAARRVETILRLEGLDAQNRYVFRPVQPRKTAAIKENAQ